MTPSSPHPLPPDLPHDPAGDGADANEGVRSNVVYRVQDQEGRGPFKPGFSKHWADETFGEGVLPMPTWPQEFGSDLIDRLGRRGEHFGCAVRTLNHIPRWFSVTERERLAALGFSVVSLRVNRILAESDNQIVFARTRPLARGATIVPWSTFVRIATPLDPLMSGSPGDVKGSESGALPVSPSAPFCDVPDRCNSQVGFGASVDRLHERQTEGGPLS